MFDSRDIIDEREIRSIINFNYALSVLSYIASIAFLFLFLISGMIMMLFGSLFSWMAIGFVRTEHRYWCMKLFLIKLKGGKDGRSSKKNRVHRSKRTSRKAKKTGRK